MMVSPRELYKKGLEKLNRKRQKSQPWHEDIPTTTSESPYEPNERKKDSGPKDLWQIAYEKLSNEDQQLLADNELSLQPNETINHREDRNMLRTLQEVIQLTEEKYEAYQNGGLKIPRGSGKEDINIRDVTHRILDATLSFKDIISAIAAFDPTSHASSAWAIVSLGLTMTKNHKDIRDSLFRSSEFLADVLARCAFIEKTHYRNNESETKDKIEKALVQVYTSILGYSARVQKQHKANIGKRMLESVPAVSNHPIIQMQSSIKNDEQVLHQWVQRNEHLQHQKNAEDMLDRIDEMIASIRHLHQKLDYSNLRNAEGASFDSYENQHDAECIPGTREEILQQVQQWGNSRQGQCIFWLCGRAGTGKSTISRTVAKVFQEQGQLGASFLFKRGGGDRGNAKRLFSTITRQLVTAVPHLAHGVSNAIDEDPDVSTKSLREQFNKLVLQPLSGLGQCQRSTNILIVIDALDECDGDEDVQVILELLPQLQEIKSVHCKIFLTSRPELSIQQNLRGMENGVHRDFFLHEIPESEIEQDISTFLKHKLSEIRAKRAQNPDWPGEVTTQSLVKISVPLFICAATICRQLEDTQWDPEETLIEILTYQNGNDFEGTYMPILDRLLLKQSEQKRKRLVDEFQKVVGVIILLKTPLSIVSISRLTGVRQSLIELRLNSLHSVLSVPDDTTKPVRLFHLSFRDFLLDASIRAKTDCWVDEKKKHSDITLQCLRVMREGLKKNLCKLEHNGTQRMEIDQDLIDKSIPPELQYSCRYWAQHLEQCENPMERMDDVFTFLQERFLYWMEAMSILGLASELVGIIDTTRRLISNERSQLCAFLQDTRRFILQTRHVADIAPLQLYSSGLIFAPTKSIIRETFEVDIPRWIRRSPEVEHIWSAELETLESNSCRVSSIAFSADGKLLASASDDATVKIWDPASGALRNTLEGHSNSVRSVAFSADGQLLASASYDRTVKIWDPASGALRNTLEGHSYLVNSVAFSADGQLLASASSDGTVNLWDPASGVLHQSLDVNTDWVMSVAFSADGKLLASASDDRTVKIWDPASGALHQSLEGHSDSVISVAFSADGRLLASASADGTVKLWDPASGALHQTLDGHSDWVMSVAFSADGQLLASASYDRTVKLWNPASGALRNTLEGHSHTVNSVAFSSDGRLLASASNDSTVKLWDPASGTLYQYPESHSGPVGLVVFSADGRLLASASDDTTVKIWDPASGALRQTFKGHSDLVTSVAFSADGELLASASYDKTVKLWNMTSGVLHQSLDGHSDSVMSVAFSADGRLLVSTSMGRTVKIWDPASGTLRNTLHSHSGSINSVALSTDGRLLAFSVSEDNAVKLWDTASGTLLQSLEGHSNSVYSVALSADGQLLASGSMDSTVKLWDPASGTLRNTLEGHSYTVNSVAFSSDGRLLASASNDSTVKLWDPASGALRHTLEGYGCILKLRFAEDDSYLETDSGIINLPPSCVNNHSLHGTQTQVCVSDQEWVTVEDQKLLWLPAAYRSMCVAVRNGVLVMGHASGRVTFFEFRL